VVASTHVFHALAASSSALALIRDMPAKFADLNTAAPEPTGTDRKRQKPPVDLLRETKKINHRG
jgi:hypothetical protein